MVQKQIGKRWTVKLKTIKLTNFRGVENLEIPFDGKSTNFVWYQWCGKVLCLRAVDLIYANIIARLTASKKLAELQYDDISYGRSKAIIGGSSFLFMMAANAVMHVRSTEPWGESISQRN